MKGHTKTALGIDIAERHVSFALVGKSGEGVQTLAAATMPLPGTGAHQGPSVSARLVSSTLKRLLCSVKPGGMKAAVAFSTGPTVLQLLDMPPQMPANVREFVDHELKQYVVLSGQDILSDFCGLGAGFTAARRLLVAAAAAAKVRRIVQACRSAGVTAQVIEPALLAYVRGLVGRGGPSSCRPHVLLAVLTDRDLSIGTFCDGVLDFTRVREVPVEANNAELFCAWLAQELRAVMRYRGVENAEAARELDIRVVAHDVAYAKEEIQGRLGALIEMDSLTVIGLCDSSMAARVGDEGSARPTPSLAAVGAARRLLEPPCDDPRINLLPAEVTRARSSARRLLIAANVAAGVFLGMVVLSQFLARATDARHRRIEQIQLSPQFATTPARLAQERCVTEEIARLRQDLQRLQVVRTRPRVDWSDVLHAARDAVRAGVSLAEFAGDDSRKFSLKGFAPSCEAALEFVRHLDRQEPFASVALSRMERRQDGGGPIEYQIDCSLK